MKLICSEQKEVSFGKIVYRFISDGDVYACNVKNERHIKSLIDKHGCEIQNNINVDGMTNRDVNKWAEKHGINYRSRQCIKKYALKKFNYCDFGGWENPATMLKKIIKLDLGYEPV